MEVLFAELNERTEAATDSYSVTGDSLQYIYSVPVTKNHRNIRSRCLVHEFSFTDIFNDFNHGYRAALLKKNSLWLLQFYMVVATFFYHSHSLSVSYDYASIMKRCAKRCALQLYQTSLSNRKQRVVLNGQCSS